MSQRPPEGSIEIAIIETTGDRSGRVFAYRDANMEASASAHAVFSRAPGGRFQKVDPSVEHRGWMPADECVVCMAVRRHLALAPSRPMVDPVAWPG